MKLSSFLRRLFGRPTPSEATPPPFAITNRSKIYRRLFTQQQLGELAVTQLANEQKLPVGEIAYEMMIAYDGNMSEGQRFTMRIEVSQESEGAL